MSASIHGLQRYSVGGVLLALVMGFSFLSPIFFSYENLINILLASATIGLLSMGAAFVIGAAGLDLSVGSVMALSASVAGSFAVSTELWWPIVILICLVTGCLVGLLNGFFIARVGIPAFIVTLGMLSVARGVAFIFTDGRPLYGMPEEITFVGQGILLSIPVPVWVFVCSGILLHILLRYTAFGSRTLCIGDNQSAVRNAGVNIEGHLFSLYMLSGVLAALAGLIYMGRINAADPSAGMMYELTAITGAILGGTRLFGGKASVIGAMVGALIMGVLQNGLTLLAVPSYYQQVAIGAVLILAVWVEQFSKRNH